MTEALHTVWTTTEGQDWLPLLCCAGDQATALVADLLAHRICSAGAVTPCCRNEAPGHACTRDMFDATDTDRPIEITMRAAMARGISWPSDQGQTEPEYSVLDDRRPA